tara:strand:+ start:4748 stop:5521 length:774 start_codon:yes stop_codon:yes gene_type:complete
MNTISTLSIRDSIYELIKFAKCNQRFVHTRWGDVCLLMLTDLYVNQILGKSNKNKVNDSVISLMKNAWNLDGKDVLVGINKGTPNHEGGHNVPTKALIQTGLNFNKKFLAAVAIERIFLDYPQECIEFFNYINKTSYLFVGQYYNKCLDKFYGPNVGWCQTPSFNSINYTEDILKDILTNLKTSNPRKIIFSCGQAARVLCSELYNKFEGTLLDVGSMSDMVIINCEQFKNIAKRTHVSVNLTKIKNLLRIYEKSLS